MNAVLKIQRNGLVTIPKGWRKPGFNEGEFVEAIFREDGILLHPIKHESARPPAKAGGWRACLGGIAPSVIDKLQTAIDKEFSRIDPEEWK